MPLENGVCFNSDITDACKECDFLENCKEYFMSKKIEITKTALDETYKKGCSDVKDTLKNLFPDYEFEKDEKETELEDGQIYKQYGNYVMLHRLDCTGENWVWGYLTLTGYMYPKTKKEILHDIKWGGFTLCPNATIRVDND